MTHLKRRSLWTSRRRSHGNDCQLHGTYNTMPPLAEYNALLGQRFQAHFAQDIDPHDASGVALLGSRFATQKEMKWHCKLHSSSDKMQTQVAPNQETSARRSKHTTNSREDSLSFDGMFFAQSSFAFQSLRKDLYTILPSIVRPLMVGSFFEPGDWDKGQVCWSRATYVYICPAFSGKAC